MRLRHSMPLLMLAGLVLLGATCRHEVVTPEPIKIEITIRQEIHHYTHAANDAVAGKGDIGSVVDDIFSEPGPGSSILHEIEGLFIGTAYADNGDARARLTAALEGRKARYPTVQKHLKDGSAGENRRGLLSFRATAKTRSDAAYATAVKKTIAAENADRETFISIVAAYKGIAVSVVREEQHKANVAAAPAGAWVEVKQGGKWVWSQK